MRERLFRGFDPQFLLLMSGQFISNLGDALAGMAIVWLVIQLTDSPMTRGITMALSVIPMLLLSPVSGAVVDRFRRRSILATSDFIRFLIDAVFAVVIMFGYTEVWHIYLFTILRSAATIFYDPALSALVQTLIPSEQLVKANGLQLLVRNITVVVGPTLAGLSLAKVGIGAVVLVDGLTFLISALILSRMKVPGDDICQGPVRASTWEQLAEGWLYVKNRGWIIVLTCSFVLLNAGSSVMGVLLPFCARDTLGLQVAGYGLLGSVSATGAVSASLLLSTLKLTTDKKRMLVSAITALALSMVGLALSSHISIALPILFVSGFTGPFIASTTNALYQSTVPRDYMGRVGVFRRMVSVSMMPVAHLLTGVLTTMLGYQTCLYIAGVLIGISAAMVHLFARLPGAITLSVNYSVEGK